MGCHISSHSAFLPCSPCQGSTQGAGIALQGSRKGLMQPGPGAPQNHCRAHGATKATTRLGVAPKPLQQPWGQSPCLSGCHRSGSCLRARTRPRQREGQSPPKTENECAAGGAGAGEEQFRAQADPAQPLLSKHPWAGKVQERWRETVYKGWSTRERWNGSHCQRGGLDGV